MDIIRGNQEEYTMEELIPIVARLTDEYTSKDSTSITYEMANQLMEAAIYCIRTDELYCGYIGNPQTAYESGYTRVLEECKESQTSYNALLQHFNDYGNKNYRDTVTKAILGFFQYYDARFAPQHTIITMDYPTMLPLKDETGIHRIREYIEQISLEQRLLKRLPENYIRNTLSEYQKNYETYFFNLGEVIWNHLILCWHYKKDPKNTSYDEIKSVFNMETNEERNDEIEEWAREGSKELLNSYYYDEEEVCNYMKQVRPLEYWIACRNRTSSAYKG